MVEKPLTAFLVNGYGHDLESPLGKVYLPKMLWMISVLQPTVVGCVGGVTEGRSYPDLSEARVMADWLARHLAPEHAPGHVGAWDIRLVETTYSNYENSRGGAEILRLYAQGRKYVHIWHGCEAQRGLAVLLADRNFMADLVDDVCSDITLETASWERADPFKQVANIQQVYHFIQHQKRAEAFHLALKARAMLR